MLSSFNSVVLLSLEKSEGFLLFVACVKLTFFLTPDRETSPHPGPCLLLPSRLLWFCAIWRVSVEDPLFKIQVGFYHSPA